MAEKKSGAKVGAKARAERPAGGIQKTGAGRGRAKAGNAAVKAASGPASSPKVVKAAVSTRRVTAPRAKPAGSRPPGRSRGALGTATKRPKVAKPVPALSEEDQIRSAKYLPRDLPPRLFEEERFLFPESYGVNRVRLLVKDPDWLFAHWDVDPKSFEDLKRNLGERAMALSRLTLRVVDAVHGGSSDVLLPVGARGWYIRADAARRSYRAELGVTLPSGEFRRLAESNVVTTPRVGPSRERATRRVTFSQARHISGDATLLSRADERPDAGEAVGPWRGPSIDASQPGSSAAKGTGAPAPEPRRPAPSRPGASDAFRPGGASDVHRR